MCENEKGDKSWLKKIRPWYGHDNHYHVRHKCPEKSIDSIKNIWKVNREYNPEKNQENQKIIDNWERRIKQDLNYNKDE